MATATKAAAAQKRPTLQNRAEVYGALTENAETKTTLIGSVHKFLIRTSPDRIRRSPDRNKGGPERIDIPCVCVRDSQLEELLTKGREVHAIGYMGNDSLGRGTFVITLIEVVANGEDVFELPAPEDF